MYLKILVTFLSVFLLSCSNGSDSSSDADSAFYEGVWEGVCLPLNDIKPSMKFVFSFEKESGSSYRYEYDDEECSEGEELGYESAFLLNVGEKTLSEDGVEVTELDLIIAGEYGTTQLDIVYVDGDILYFGLYENGLFVRPTKLNYDWPYTRVR